MDFEINSFSDRERKVAALRLTSTKKLKRIYTNKVHPMIIEGPQLDTLDEFSMFGFHKRNKVEIFANKQILNYVGKGPYVNAEILAPHIVEDAYFYYPPTSYHNRIRPDIYILPNLARQYLKQETWPARIEKHSHNPLDDPIQLVDLPIYPFSPKFRSNLCSFQDDDGVHLIHVNGELVNDLSISDLHKDRSISVNSNYKCPKNVPGFIRQMQYSGELEKKRLLVQQQYHCSILGIDKNPEDSEESFNIKPIEVLKFSSKVADATMYKYTGDVVTLLEKGELLLWNGENTIRLLHKPTFESPLYMHRNYARKVTKPSGQALFLQPMKTHINRRCTFTEHEQSVLVSAHDKLFLFDFRQKLSYQKPILTLKENIPIYGLKHNPYEPFQFAITSPTTANILDQRFIAKPLHSWDILLETDPPSNIEFFPRNEYCIENPFDGLITWTESGDVLLYPYENKYSWTQDIIAQYDRIPLSIPAFNNFGELSYPAIMSSTKKFNRFHSASIRYSPDTQIHGIHFTWYKQIYGTLKDALDTSDQNDEKDEDEYISPSQVLFLQLSSMGDMFSELFSFSSSTSVFSSVWCDFKSRNEDVVIRRIKLLKDKDCRLQRVENITKQMLDIVHRADSYYKTEQNGGDFEDDKEKLKTFLEANWVNIKNFINLPKSLFAIWSYLNELNEKKISIEVLKEFLLSQSTLLHSSYFETPRQMFQKDPVYQQLPLNPDAEIYVYRIRNTKTRKIDYDPNEYLDESFYDEGKEDKEDEDEDSIDDLSNSVESDLKAKVKMKLESVSLIFYDKETFHNNFPELAKEYARQKQTLKVRTGADLERGTQRLSARTIIGASGNYNLDLIKLKQLWSKSSPLNQSSSFTSTPSTPFYSQPHSRTQTPLSSLLKTPMTSLRGRTNLQTPLSTPRTPSFTSLQSPLSSSQLSASQLSLDLASQNSMVSSQDYDSFMSLFEDDLEK